MPRTYPRLNGESVIWKRRRGRERATGPRDSLRLAWSLAWSIDEMRVPQTGLVSQTGLVAKSRWSRSISRLETLQRRAVRAKTIRDNNFRFNMLLVQ